MNTFEFALDLSKQTAMEPLRLRQGDKNGTEVRATIYDHGTLVTGSYTSRICLSLPDGEHYYRKTGTFSAGVATVTIDEQQAASVVGRSYGYIQLLSGSTVIASTASFPVLVLPDATADATVPESYDTAIQEAIDGLNEAVADLPDTVEDVLDQHHEWTTTVQDNSVTDAKLVQSGGILSRNARLMYRLANLLTHRTDEGTLAAISDAAKTPMAGLSVYGLSTQDGTPTPSAPVPIVSVEPDSEGNISLWARGRNLVNMAETYPYSRTQDGITLTVNADGSITANGTAATAVWSHTTPTAPSMLLPAGTYTTYAVLPDGTVPNGYCPRVGDLSSGTAITYSRGVRTFTLDEPTLVYVVLVALANTTASNESVRVMLEVGSTATTYQPYIETVTAIDLDGHELRSLPDGTRDELTVDAEGHAVLTQRVGVSVWDGSSDENWRAYNYTSGGGFYIAGSALPYPHAMRSKVMCTSFLFGGSTSSGDNTFYVTVSDGTQNYICSSISGVDAWREYLAAHPITTIYQLNEPVTIDLGTVPLVPLVGPDLTAQTVPTAPFVLDAERDLNTTLARLESAIAALA